MTKTTESKAKTTSTTTAAAAQDTKENNHSQGQHEKSTTKTTEKTSSKDENKAADDGKKRELSEAQIRRLKEGLRKEAEKIHKPQPKQFTPNTFHDLQPYFDMSTAIFVHELPTDVRHGYTNRALATGLCEPTVALRMDSDIPPKVPSSTSPRHARQQDQQQKQKSKEDTERPPAEGSTRLPQFPAVHFAPKKIQKKEYRFNDVPTIRQEVHEQFSPRGSRKVEDDYKKTKADFYRMELDKMDEYSEFSRPHMKAAYFAYLQNTAGSSRAVKECVRKVENPNKDSAGDERKSTGSKNELQQRGGSRERAEENPGKTEETKTAGEKANKKDEKDAKDKKSKEKTVKKEPQQQASETPQQQQQGGKERTDGKADKKQAEKTQKKTEKDDRGVEAQNNDAGKSTVKKKK